MMGKTKSTDEAVMTLLRKVQDKKDQIVKASKKPQWKTNCTIGYDPETASGRVNIMTVRDPIKIVDLYAFLIQKADYRQRAATDLDVTTDLTYMGYPIEDWKDDLKSRVDQLNIDKKKKELEVLDKRVNSIVSPDQRREMELVALEAELAD